MNKGVEEPSELRAVSLYVSALGSSGQVIHCVDGPVAEQSSSSSDR